MQPLTSHLHRSTLLWNSDSIKSYLKPVSLKYTRFLYFPPSCIFHPFIQALTSHLHRSSLLWNSDSIKSYQFKKYTRFLYFLPSCIFHPFIQPLTSVGQSNRCSRDLSRYCAYLIVTTMHSVCLAGRSNPGSNPSPRDSTRLDSTHKRLQSLLDAQ